jgi:hypothetical protein
MAIRMRDPLSLSHHVQLCHPTLTSYNTRYCTMSDPGNKNKQNKQAEEAKSRDGLMFDREVRIALNR